MLDIPSAPTADMSDRRRIIDSLVREILALRAKGDAQAMIALLAPDFVYQVRGAWPMWPYHAGPIKRAQFAASASRNIAEFEVLRTEIHECLIDGESAAAHATLDTRNRGAGSSAEFDLWMYLRIRDKLIVEAATYVDAAKAGRLLNADLFEVHRHASAWARRRRATEPSRAQGAVRAEAAVAETGQSNPAAAEARYRKYMECVALDLFALRAKGDLEGMLSRLAPDFIYNPRGDWTKPPLIADRCDRAMFAESLRMVNVEYEDLGGPIHEFLVDGDRIAVHRTIKVRNRGAGDIAEVDEWVYFRVRAGLIVEMASYVDATRVAGVQRPAYGAPA